MQIPVKIADGSKLGEWAIIELQGDLRNRSNDTLHSQFIGDLHYTEKGAPVLIVGHHILYGKEQALEKPFIVAERVRHKSEDSTRTEYLVRAVVKRKLLFKSRPKPIIATLNKSV
ncbi:chromosome transmission fidelity protein 8 homolog isoform X1 [Schistocerca americana]|uniref:chromosome transmission fidelity protein 8 homolog isoform X1 n=1 Tax=Schistocerca americana TaxID=7009 RepID=UPI001F4F22D0|nr:chromosome transmission fidelity protein 8 homolog isoform X1 [Schistocerca americana]